MDAAAVVTPTKVVPSDDVIKEKILELIPQIDLQTTGLKKFIRLLSGELGGADLKPKKEFIRDALTEAINNSTEGDDEDEEDHEEEEPEDDESSDGEEEEEKEERARKKSGKGGGGLTAKKEISDKLAAFLRKGKSMPRTEVVKSLWEYIREHNLQNPDNKREILLDAAMQDVFGCESFTMFTMNKYVGAHIHPFKPVDLTTNSTSSSKKRKRKTKGSPGAKKRKPGTQPPYRLSAELEAVVGKPILPRPQVVSGIWGYIKTNDLQNPDDKREILCDEKLKAVMKKDKVTMFNMNQLITPHLIEKVDKALYQVEEESDSD